MFFNSKRGIRSVFVVLVSLIFLVGLTNCQERGQSHSSGTISGPTDLVIGTTGSEVVLITNDMPYAAVNISAKNLPAGVTATSCTAKPFGGCSFNLISNNATPGNASISISGMDTNALSVNLTVSGPSSSVILSAPPEALIGMNDSATVTFTVTNLSSTEADNITASNLPAYIQSTTCTASPNGSCDLTLTLTSNAPSSEIAPINISGTNTKLVQMNLDVSDMPSKEIQIYNNTQETIYPVIETSMTQTDQWLQAQFKVTDVINGPQYPHNHVYRIYINPVKGIKPNDSVNIMVPFYSNLETDPQPNGPDQYINWWNGVRIYLYDNQQALANTRNNMGDVAVSPATVGPLCYSNNCETLNVYSNTVGLPDNDPSQLAEYTFGGISNNPKGPSYYSMDYTPVDYDLSYVDEVYLPVALEPLGNPNIGYTGTTLDFNIFEKILQNFVTNNATDANFWPTFIAPAYDHGLILNPRIPGAYMMLLGTSDTISSTNSTAFQNMWSEWNNCSSFNPSDCASLANVKTLFTANYAAYVANSDCPEPHIPNTPTEMMNHVYGWVPFNEGCKKASDNPLSGTTLPNSLTYDSVSEEDYTAGLQYSYNRPQNPTNYFNPYVQFIHDPNFLDMNAYAFSIDDAVGNMNELGDGLILTVGGPNGLINKSAFDPKKVITVNLGANSDQLFPWASYGVCVDPNNPQPTTLLNNSNSFDITYIKQFPCTVLVIDNQGNPYTFEINQNPAPPNMDQSSITCPANSPNGWCSRVNVNKQFIDTAPPAGSQNLTVYLGGTSTSWNMNSFSASCASALGNVTAQTFTLPLTAIPNSSPGCLVSMNDQNGHKYDFYLTNDPLAKSCTQSDSPAWCQQINVNGYNVSAPGPD